MFTKAVSGVNFSIIAKAMDQANISSTQREDFEKFCLDVFEGDPCIPMATHSMGGREWTLAEGVEAETVPFFPEDFGEGGWCLLTENTVTHVECTSATSGSSLEATRGKDGTWSLVLQVPNEDGQPYQGCYWESFHRATGESFERVKPAPVERL